MTLEQNLEAAARLVYHWHSTNHSPTPIEASEMARLLRFAASQNHALHVEVSAHNDSHGDRYRKTDDQSAATNR